MRIAMLAFSNIEYTVELTEALADLEEVMLLIPDKDARRFSGVIKPHVNLQPFYYPRMRYPTNLYMIWAILKKLNHYKPDILHLQKGHPWFNLAIPLLKRHNLVTTIHDVILLDWPSQKIPNFTYLPPIKYANQLIVHGKYLKEAMVSGYERQPEDIHVLRRGVNSIYTRFCSTTTEQEGLTVLYFGRIWGYKGIKYLIEAEPLIAAKVPDFKIIIAGEGEDFQKYRDMMVNKERFIVYNEYIPDQSVAELFQRASVVVLPYIDGSQSGVIPQAYAFQKPVVITNVGSLPENVEDGVTGYIVPPKNSKELAARIIELLTNDEKRKQMGANAYRKTKNELAWESIAPQTVAVYEKALAGNMRIRLEGGLLDKS